MSEIGKLLEGAFHKAMQEKLMVSFCVVDRDERKARLRTIMALSVELERIKTETIFATGLAEGVIEGNWDAAHSLGLHFTFATEGEHIRSVEQPRWAKFVDIIRAECVLAHQRVKGHSADA